MNGRGGGDGRAAIVCRHCASGKRPILYAERDEPVENVDSGWQFLCDVEQHDNVEDAEVWSVEEVLQAEPTLRRFIDLPPGCSLTRADAKSEWHSSQTE